MLPGLGRPVVIQTGDCFAKSSYNANRSEEPVRYTKKRLLRNQETKFLPPLARPFAFLDFV